MAQGYEDVTNSALVDCKMILERVLYGEDRNRWFDRYGVDRARVWEAWRYLDDIIYDDKISLEDCETGVLAEWPVESGEEAMDALRYIRDRFDEIEDPWFWTENEDVMNDVMEVLNDAIGDDEDE